MGPKSVGQIASAMPMISRPAISQHLRILLETSLVTYETQGRRSLYRLNLRGLKNLRQYMGSLGLSWN
jgi:DNA-binding transcriptional ArsR family regulator